MYTIEGRVRYSEVDSGNKIKLPAIVNYFQDCTTFQSEDMELGHQTLEKYGKVWILSSWQIEVDRYPLIGEKIKVDTWSAGFDLWTSRIPYADGGWRSARMGTFTLALYGYEKGKTYQTG